jgi:hypothetical protein
MTDPSPVYLSTLRLAGDVCAAATRLAADADQTQVLRSILMKPEHEAYVETSTPEVLQVARGLHA